MLVEAISRYSGKQKQDIQKTYLSIKLLWNKNTCAVQELAAWNMILLHAAYVSDCGAAGIRMPASLEHASACV